MRRRSQRISYSQKLQIAEQASQGHSDRQIAQQIECSVWTVRKWRRRYQKHGNKGLRSKRGRPVTCSGLQTRSTGLTNKAKMGSHYLQITQAQGSQ